MGYRGALGNSRRRFAVLGQAAVDGLDEERLQGRVEIAKNRASRIPDIDEDSLRSCFHTGPGPTSVAKQS